MGSRQRRSLLGRSVRSLFVACLVLTARPSLAGAVESLDDEAPEGGIDEPRTERQRLRAMSYDELRDQRDDVGLGGPIALLSVGGGLFLLGLPTLLVGVAQNSACYSYCAGDATIAVGAVMAVTGAGLATGGGIWLGSRLGERGKYDDEIERRQKAGLRLTYGVLPTAGGLAFQLHGTF